MAETYKKHEYKILAEMSTSKLEHEVETHLFQGWLPQGGLVIEPVQGYYCQAMIKLVEPKWPYRSKV
jgi:hypothetical protein